MAEIDFVITFNTETEEVRVRSKKIRTTQTAKASFNFDEVYDYYPRKEGRAKGIQWLKTHVKSEPKFRDVMTAVQCFSSQIEEEGREKKYIPLFSTWVKSYTDYLGKTHLESMSQERGIILG